MRKRKIMTWAGVLALAVSSMAGCKGSDAKETTAAAATTGTQEELNTTGSGDKNVETTANVNDETTAAIAPGTSEVPTENEWDDPNPWSDRAEGPTGAGDAGLPNTSGISELAFRAANQVSIRDYLITFDDTTKIQVVYRELEDEIKGTTVLDAETASKIEALYEKYKMWRWAGYNRAVMEVTDGTSYGLHILFRDGQDMGAAGYMVYPKDFGLFYDELEMILRPVIDQVKANTPESERIRRDDEYISLVSEACKATLADPLYFGEANGLVKVSVDPTGTVKVLSFTDAQMAEDFNATVEMLLVGSGASEDSAFQSDSYIGGSATILEFTWNRETVKWDVTITNQNPGSMYCK